MPGGDPPFQSFTELPPGAFSRRAWKVTAPGMVRGSMLLLDSYVRVSKLVSFAVLRPDPAAIGVSKLVSFAVLRPDPAVVAVAKLVAYAVLIPVPFWRFEPLWANPVLPRRLRQSLVAFRNEALLAPPPSVDTDDIVISLLW